MIRCSRLHSAIAGLLLSLPIHAAFSAPARNSLASVGAADAPVSIVAFVDLECKFSAATVPLLEKLAAQHPQQVRLQLRQFPLSQHSHAEMAHEAALAAGAQGKYFAMVDLIQANQKQMSREQFLSYAALLHLDVNRFRRDLDTHAFQPEIDNDLAEGRALGIQVTPTLFMNGQQLSGSQDEATLSETLQSVLPAPSDSAGIETAANAPLSANLMHELVEGATNVIGPADAPVTIVEFTDFQCPFCRRSVDPMHRLVAESGGKVRWIYRSYPLDFHEHSEIAAEAALAAEAQGKFWQMHDVLFAHQDQLDKEHLIGFAKDMGLDVARFQDDLNTERYRAVIAADRALGVKAGIDGTPLFIINGQPVIGTRTLPELQQAVQLALNTRPGAPASGAMRSATDTHHVVLGPPQSPVTITWFSDVEAAAAPRIGKLLRAMADLPDAQVHVVFKNFALANHPSEALAHRALLAALDKGQFWPLYEALAGQQLSTDPAAAKVQIITFAKQAGLGTEAIAAAFDDQKLAQDEEQDSLEAVRRGVRGVPVVFINGKRIDGVQPLALYQGYIEQESQPQSAALAPLK